MPWKVTVIPLAVSFALALLLGILIEPIRLDGTAGLVAAVAACAITGAWISALVRGLGGVVFGTVLGTSVIVLTLALKVARWPDAPVVGDGPGGMWALFLFYAAASLAGAALGIAAGGVSRVIRRRFGRA